VVFGSFGCLGFCGKEEDGEVFEMGSFDIRASVAGGLGWSRGYGPLLGWIWISAQCFGCEEHTCGSLSVSSSTRIVSLSR
jgi:hypothetical protein